MKTASSPTPDNENAPCERYASAPLLFRFGRDAIAAVRHKTDAIGFLHTLTAVPLSFTVVIEPTRDPLRSK